MPKAVMRRVFVGIDAGKKGGLAAISYSGNIASVTPMPGSESEVWDWFDQFPHGTIVAVIEKVASRPGQGVKSMFTFGQGYGSLRMALTACSASWEAIRPQDWMRELKIPQEKDYAVRKAKLVAHARRLYPRLPLWRAPRTKGKQEAIADALLIAHYCRMRSK